MERIPLAMVEFRRPVFGGHSMLHAGGAVTLEYLPLVAMVAVGDEWYPREEFARMVPAPAKPIEVTPVEPPYAADDVGGRATSAAPRRGRSSRA